MLSTTVAQWTFDNLPAQEVNGTGLAIIQNQFRAGYENTSTGGVFLPTGYYDANTSQNDSGSVDLSADSGVFALQSVAASYHRSSGADYYSRHSTAFTNLGFGSNSWGFGGSNSQGGDNYFQFKTSTTGLTGIHFSFDQLRNHANLSDDWSLWYSTTLNESTQGGTGLDQHSDQLSSFTKLHDYTLGTAGSSPTDYASYSFDLSSTTALDNRSEVWFRLVNDGGAESSSHRSFVDNVLIASDVEAMLDIAPGVYFDIATGSTAGTAVTGRIHLLEPNQSSSATFQIVGGTGQSLFDTNTVEDSNGIRRGELVVAAGVTLSSLSTYTLDITASDGTTTSPSQTIMINVVDSTLQSTLFAKHLAKAENEASYTGTSQINGYLNLLQSDGSFSDIDYSVDGNHYVDALERIAAMSEAYVKSATFGSSSSYKLDVYNAIEKWISSINSIPNIHNTVTHPWGRSNLMAGIGLMMFDALRDDAATAAPALATRASELYDSIIEETEKLYTGWTDYNSNFFGANRAYRYDGMFKRAALLDDYNRPNVQDDSAFADFTSEGSYADIASLVESGFVRPDQYGVVGQTDDSAFAQHTGSGTQNLTLTYGKDWAIRTTRVFEDSLGTPWEADIWQYDRVAEYYLSGYQWMHYAGQGDYAANGRANGVKDTLHDMDSTVKGWVDNFLSVVGSGVVAREAELVTMSNQLGNAASGTLTGNKDFWNHDFLVHRNDDYYVSVNMNSVRTTGPESGNGSGKLSFYMSDGFTQILRTGEEYNETRVAWNWQALPGTTAEQRTGSLPLVNWGGNGQRGDNQFAGSVSNGAWGLSAFQYDKENSFATVNANKGYYFFGDEFVALGSDVRRESSGNNQEIWTTLNQTLWTSDVVYNVGSGAQTISFGSDTQLDFDNLTSPAWFHQDNVGYVVLPSSSSVDVKLWAEQRTGDWNDLNNSYSNGDNQSVEVFQLSINHGTNPSAGQYQYLVVPDIASSAMQSYVDSLPVSVIANSATIQAVRNDVSGVTEIAFYAAGSVEISPGLTVGADAPALVLVHEQSGQMEISVSDPNHSTTLDEINVTVSRQLSGNNVTWDSQSGLSTITFALSNDLMLAGQSVVQTASEGAGVSADFVDDNFIDGLDFLAWQQGFGTANATQPDGDADSDIDVDGDDLAAWQTTYGQAEAPLLFAAATSSTSASETGGEIAAQLGQLAAFSSNGNSISLPRTTADRRLTSTESLSSAEEEIVDVLFFQTRDQDWRGSSLELLSAITSHSEIEPASEHSEENSLGLDVALEQMF